MKFIFWSSMRACMLLALLFAGTVIAVAQTDGSEAEQPTGQEQQTGQVQPTAPPQTVAVAAGALPVGIEEAAGKARRVATEIGSTLETLKTRLADPSLPAGELARAREQLELVR